MIICVSCIVFQWSTGIYDLDHDFLTFTSAMEAPTSSGKVAIITDARRQLRVNAIPNAATVSEIFCTIVDKRSASALRTNAASAANFDTREPVLFSSKSNHPTSLPRIATNKNKKQGLRITKNTKKRAYTSWL